MSLSPLHTNRRLAVANDRLKEEHGAGPVLTYDAADFEKMIIEQRIDTVVVATIDCTHHTYLIRAMELGCDTITEKPMTTDCPKNVRLYRCR